MLNKLTIIMSLAAVGFGAWFCITTTNADTNYWSTNIPSIYWTPTTNSIYWTPTTNSIRRMVITSDYDWGAPFLTISNRPFVYFRNGQYVVRVTDAEWNTITNHFPENIKTNSITFYDKR